MEVEMVDRGNVNKHRSSMCGLKVEETSKWGHRTAVERYGRLDQPDMKAKDQSEPQRLGDPNNQRGPGWQDDHRNDWVRGANEDATTKPGYVPGYRGKK
jgi:hypothetical protein